MCNIEINATSDTSPVDQFQKKIQQADIYDTLGNVMEWTTDNDLVLLPGNQPNERQIVKGGCWISDESIKLASRFRVEPDSTSNIIGFRCVVD